MCREVKITTGAMLVAALSPRVVLAGMAVAGSGVTLVVLAGAGLGAYAAMVVVGWASVATILLLRRRADPRRHAVPAPPPAAPRRAPARVLPGRPARALPRTVPALDEVANRTPAEDAR